MRRCKTCLKNSETTASWCSPPGVADLARRSRCRAGAALKYAAKLLRTDRDVAFAAVQRCDAALQYVDKTLRGDRGLVAAFKRELRQDRKLALVAVVSDGADVAALLHDTRFVEEAVGRAASALKYGEACRESSWRPCESTAWRSSRLPPFF